MICSAREALEISNFCSKTNIRPRAEKELDKILRKIEKVAKSGQKEYWKVFPLPEDIAHIIGDRLSDMGFDFSLTNKHHSFLRNKEVFDLWVSWKERTPRVPPAPLCKQDNK
jgi:hypothetical protein